MRNLSLLQAAEKLGKFGDKAFVCFNGKRHWVPSTDRLADYGLRWPDDLTLVESKVLQSFAVGGHLPYRDIKNLELKKISSSLSMREYLASDLYGMGVEVGAGANPFPIPLECEVLYGDRFSKEELLSFSYPGQNDFEFATPLLITSFETFDGLAD